MTGNQQQERIGDEMLSMVRCDGFQKIRNRNGFPSFYVKRIQW
jgi:hypothetical protein